MSQKGLPNAACNSFPLLEKKVSPGFQDILFWWHPTNLEKLSRPLGDKWSTIKKTHTHMSNPISIPTANTLPLPNFRLSWSMMPPKPQRPGQVNIKCQICVVLVVVAVVVVLVAVTAVLQLRSLMQYAACTSCTAVRCVPHYQAHLRYHQ